MSEKWDNSVWANQVIAARVERLKDPAIRQQMSDTMHEVWARPEYREKHSKAMKEIQTPELLLQKSDAMKAVWADEGKRNNMLAARSPASNELCQQRSVAASTGNKATWADPVVRARRSAGIKAAKAKKKAAKEAAVLDSKDAID